MNVPEADKPAVEQLTHELLVVLARFYGTGEISRARQFVAVAAVSQLAAFALCEAGPDDAEFYAFLERDIADRIATPPRRKR